MALKLSRVSLAEVHSLCTRALASSGLYAESVEAIARTITSAERDGCQSHGLFRLPGYCNALRGGKCDPTARPVVHDAAQAIVRVDAARGLAPYALEVGVKAVSERARQNGVGVLALTNAFHFRCVWPPSFFHTLRCLLHPVPFSHPRPGSPPLWSTLVYSAAHCGTRWRRWPSKGWSE